LLGGILLPFLISFLDISLRSILQADLNGDLLMGLSFTWLVLMYAVGYHFLWKHLLIRKGVNTTELLEKGTLVIILGDFLMYASLFQKTNPLSNIIWAGFYLLLIALFYLLGKRLSSIRLKRLEQGCNF